LSPRADGAAVTALITGRVRQRALVRKHLRKSRQSSMPPHWDSGCNARLPWEYSRPALRNIGRPVSAWPLAPHSFLVFLGADRRVLSRNDAQADRHLTGDAPIKLGTQKLVARSTLSKTFSEDEAVQDLSLRRHATNSGSYPRRPVGRLAGGACGMDVCSSGQRYCRGVYYDGINARDRPSDPACSDASAFHESAREKTVVSEVISYLTSVLAPAIARLYWTNLLTDLFDLRLWQRKASEG